MDVELIMACLLAYTCYKSVSKKAPTFMKEMNCEVYIYISLMRITWETGEALNVAVNIFPSPMRIGVNG